MFVADWMAFFCHFVNYRFAGHLYLHIEFICARMPPIIMMKFYLLLGHSRIYYIKSDKHDKTLNENKIERKTISSCFDGLVLLFSFMLLLLFTPLFIIDLKSRRTFVHQMCLYLGRSCTACTLCVIIGHYDTHLYDGYIHFYYILYMCLCMFTLNFSKHSIYNTHTHVVISVRLAVMN